VVDPVCVSAERLWYTRTRMVTVELNGNKNRRTNFLRFVDYDIIISIVCI